MPEGARRPTGPAPADRARPRAAVNRSAWTILAGLCLLAAAIPATPLSGQGNETYRIGLAIGGVSTLGLVVEREADWGAFELTVGTWGFRDLSVSLVHKQYIGGGEVQAGVGLGLWTVLAFPPGERMGAALAIRAPVGVQWEFVEDNSVVAEIGLNRALAVRRTDPEDDLPLNRRIVPLPGFSYRVRTGG